MTLDCDVSKLSIGDCILLNGYNLVILKIGSIQIGSPTDDNRTVLLFRTFYSSEHCSYVSTVGGLRLKQMIEIDCNSFDACGKRMIDIVACGCDNET